MYNLANVATHRFTAQPDEYVLDVQRTAAGLVSLTSSQSLSLLDPARLGDREPLLSLTASSGTVHALRVFDAAESTVCTVDDGGEVCVWDVRLAAQSARVASFRASDAPLLSLACSPSTTTIAVGTELQSHVASISIFDVRAASQLTAKYEDLHSDDITSLSFSPYNPALLMSGSTDGLVSVHDTRIADEDELTIQTFNHDASIQRAGFLNPTEIFALSNDERFALYDLAEERENGDATVDFGDLRAALGCQYVADVVAKPDGSGAIIGAGAQDKQAFELIYLGKANGPQPWALDQTTKVGLPGGHGSDIVRAFCLFDEAQLVFTGGEDGCIRAWGGGS